MIGNGKARTSSHIFPPPRSTLVQACSLIHLGRGGGGRCTGSLQDTVHGKGIWAGVLEPRGQSAGPPGGMATGNEGGFGALAASQKGAQLGAREAPGAQAREVGTCPGH